MLDYSSVLIVGAGEGFSASLARAFAREGVRVTLAARRPERWKRLPRDGGHGPPLRSVRSRRGSRPVRGPG